MRKYVKSWVTEWDCLRLYPGEECEIEVSVWKPSYEEPQDVPEVPVAETNTSSQPADSLEVSPSVPEEGAELVAPASSTALASVIPPTS